MGVPGTAGRLRRHIRDVWQIHGLGEGQNTFGGGASPVHEDDHESCVRERRPTN